MHTDPISDLLTRIRNASAVKKDEVVLPYSKVKFNIAQILQENGYIKKVEKINPTPERDRMIKAGASAFMQLRLELKYKAGKPSVESLKRISKPGRRVYAGKDKLPYVLSNIGIAIVSTSRGLMTNKEARNKGLGGEVICEVY
ncbi:30S ribosomal protein S8 [Patescibacteria group bacterium]|nr:30S ribosomal protein S8 [Patescibacteria group bacterium]MBU4512661.1 30S ribosomal protein S8 [Patescibacteria group bacterium]MCG2693566.1 30S ribosomal protein S8 [Candidatus Parcubacteria bacterium]